MEIVLIINLFESARFYKFESLEFPIAEFSTCYCILIEFFPREDRPSLPAEDPPLKKEDSELKKLKVLFL